MSKNTNSMVIVTDPKKCVGCLRCQLVCSFQKYNVFNPSKSRILIHETDLNVDEITFLDDCECCGMCVRYCAYGALNIERRI